MSDYVDNHPLAQDLPAYKDAIHNLKLNDAHFSHLMEKYEVLDKRIVRIEQGLEHIPELVLDSLKVERVNMKDSLVSYLKSA